MECVSMICNIIMAICAVLALLQYVGVFKLPFKGIKIPRRQKLHSIFGKYWYYKQELIKEKENIQNKLFTCIPITDASKIFNRETDEKLFLELFGNGNPRIGDDLKELFDFYEKLSDKGKEDFERWYDGL